MMKKILGLALAGFLAVSGTTVMAGGASCCGGSAKGDSCCDASFSKLNLTPKQKTQIEALELDCNRAMSTSERHQIFNAGLERILTPAQLSQFDAQCKAPAKAGGCPFMK
jgi:hypothetical protein